jgi:hypothetical protein
MSVDFGETWAYESIVTALPGIDLSRGAAVALQIVLFEVLILGAAWYFDLWPAALAGTAAVFVAAVGSVEMLRISTLVRAEALPDSYRQLLFGSSIEVVLGVLAYVALVTHLFVFDPQRSAEPLIAVLGADDSFVVVYLMLLVLWDVCYRIGTGWWYSITSLWRSARYRFDPRTARALRRADLENIGFGMLQLLLLPFVAGRPVLAAVLLGHVAAVAGVSGLSALVLTVRSRRSPGGT